MNLRENTVQGEWRKLHKGFTVCTFHLILLQWLNEEESDWRDFYGARRIRPVKLILDE